MSDKVTSREVSFLVLKQIFEDRSFSNLALLEKLNTYSLEPKERALCTELVYGVLENLTPIDYYIGEFSSLKRSKISPAIETILRMGIYQILYLSKIPESAAVNESVKLARRHAHLAAGGFVNGVLRSVVRKKDSLPVPDFKNELERLAFTYSLPVWMIKLFKDSYGEDAALKIAEGTKEKPKNSLRLNSLLGSAEELLKSLHSDGIETEQVPGMPYAMHYKYSGDISKTDSFISGYFSPQGIASQITVKVLDPKPGEKCTDLCAAPGGKTFLMAQCMKNEGEIFSFDIYDHKVKLMESGLSRLKIKIGRCYLGDGTVKNEAFTDAFDRVLVDAPCLGLGVIHKKSDIRFKSEESLKKICQIQEKILRNAASYVKPGGVLVYSTCSMSRDENEEQIEKFLKEHDNFLKEDFKDLLPEGFDSGYETGMITLFPHIHGTDGFFISKLRRVN